MKKTVKMLAVVLALMLGLCCSAQAITQSEVEGVWDVDLKPVFAAQLGIPEDQVDMVLEMIGGMTMTIEFTADKKMIMETITAGEVGREEYDYLLIGDTMMLNDGSSSIKISADHIILDLKFPTEEEYKRYTGGSLDAVLDTLACAISCGKKIWIRTVVVPTLNDTTEAMARYLNVLAPYRASIERYELLPFHTMGFFKYEKLGIENSLSHLSALSPEQRDELQSYINRHL